MQPQLGRQQIGWRWFAAGACFVLAFAGLLSGVSLSERPDVQTAGLMTQAYYSLGLFVFGGLDVGVPHGGPELGRAALWIAYFGAPLLTASAVIEATLRVLSPQRWQLMRMRDHIIVVGAGDLTTSYLRVLRRHDDDVRVVVVDRTIDPLRQLELSETFEVTTVEGDIAQDFLLRALRVERARRILLLGAVDFEMFEAATRIISHNPSVADRVVLHCHRLRFLRAMQGSTYLDRCSTFNAYNSAASTLVRTKLAQHFKRTPGRDTVILAGFGRFGQTVLEELSNLTPEEVGTVVVMDLDASRRVRVVEEQARLGEDFERKIVDGDISHPKTWDDVQAHVDLGQDEPVIVLGTGDIAENLRTALWLRDNWPNAHIFARTNDVSELAEMVGRERGIEYLSITELVETNLPLEWISDPRLA